MVSMMLPSNSLLDDSVARLVSAAAAEAWLLPIQRRGFC